MLISMLLLLLLLPAAVYPAGQAVCENPAFEWPVASGYCWVKRRSNWQQQQLAGSIWKPAAVHLDTDTGQLNVLVRLGKQSNAAAAVGVYLQKSLGYGDYVWHIDSNTGAVSATGGKRGGGGWLTP
jgi:hypothetical protein